QDRTGPLSPPPGGVAGGPVSLPLLSPDCQRQVHAMSRSRSLPRWWWLLVPVSLCGLSCSGSKLNSVKGKVLYKNEPLSGALVTSHPKGTDDLKVVRPTALKKEDGTFTVMTGEKEGAAAGDYVITIICSEVVQPPKGTISTAPPEGKDRLKG